MRVRDDGTVKILEQVPVPKYRNTVDINPSGSNVQTVTGVASEYTLPRAGGRYILIATGGTVWIRQTLAAVQNAAGMVCPDGVPIGPIRLIGPTISCIAAAAGRYLYFVEVLD